jgi:ubiquinone/menaquinone biosynthesis C-methylase UbiE
MINEQELIALNTVFPRLNGQLPFYLMENAHEGGWLEPNDHDEAEKCLRWAGLESGMSALDVGCGIGAVARIMHNIASPCRITGVDISPARLSQALHLAAEQGMEIDFIQSEVNNLHLPADTFDLVWARFLFQYLGDPQAALQEMIRVTRPGGTVVIVDLDAQMEQIYPIDQNLKAHITDAFTILAEIGFDPHVGRKLYAWFYKAGLKDIGVRVVPYQVYTGSLPDRDRVHWHEKLNAVCDFLIAHTGDTKRWKQFRSHFLERLQQPNTFYYSSLVAIRGTIPAI